MLFPTHGLAAAATTAATLFLLASSPLGAQALSAQDIPEDTPINQLVASAKAQLASGRSNDALTYFDVAVARDPGNYLTLFQRGATYLSLGRAARAGADFDAVLALKPDFEGALVQRAKLRGRDAQWETARDDYRRAGKEGGQEWNDLAEAEGAVSLAYAAEKSGDAEACVHQAGVALVVATTSLGLRQLRARCRFQRGEVLEGVSDLQHILNIRKEDVGPHIQISANLFYAAADMQKGIDQVTKCLQSDPDSKPCSKLRKQEKRIDKTYKQMMKLEEKNKFSAAAKLLVGDGEGGEDPGLLAEVKEETAALKADGTIHENAPESLYGHLVEKTCSYWVEAGNKARANQHCAEALQLNGNSLPALINKAQAQLDADEFEAAINTLNQAKEHHGQTQKVGELLQKAHTLLKRSKQKDYYKVLGVGRDADERSIKKAYRSAVKQHHPDKAVANGVSKAEAEKKIVALNEAYEVLTDPEKKQMFDNGHDPNDPTANAGGGGPFQGSPFGHGPGGQPIFFQQGGGGGGGGGFQFKQGGGGFQFHFNGM